jgi:hypothetical protein
MERSNRTPDGWTPDHSKAFLLLCAAGVDGFQKDELGSIIPLLQRIGIPQGRATMLAGEAFTHYKAHAEHDSVEDALVMHALEVKRGAAQGELHALMEMLHEVSRIDAGVTEGERLVLSLLEQLWTRDA